jgi:drug/metabolite transporter (DMT)-like permease
MSDDRGLPTGSSGRPPSTAGRSGTLKGIALVNLATLTWATNITLGRFLRDDIGPLTLAAARFALAAPILAALLWRRPAAERRLSRDRWLLLGMALCGVVAFAPTLYLGLRYTTAVNATLINGFGPLITGLLAGLLIGEPMSRRQVVGALVGLVGIGTLISNGSLAFWRAAAANLGDLIVVGAVMLWALYSVLGRRLMRRRSALSATALSSFMGLPLLALAAAWEVRFLPPSISPQLLLAVLYIGIVPTVGGFLAWNAGVRRLGASGAMVFYNTLPLYGALLGYFVLGEAIGPAHLVGGILVIGGALWAAQRGRN